MKTHQWLLNALCLVLTIAFSSTATLAQRNTPPPKVSQRSSESEILDWLNKTSFSQARIGLEFKGSESFVDPTGATRSTDRGEAKRSFAIDHNSDTYKLVFPTGPDLPIDDFSEQLNRAGEQGYKLTSVLYRWQRVSTLNYYLAPVAILKFHQVPHEYAWLETSSYVVFDIADFEQKYRELSTRGFHLIDHHEIFSSCDGADCGDNHRFLLEREKGVEKPTQFMIARSPVRAGFKLKNEAELTAQIKEKLSDSFHPSYVFSKWEILLTQTENSDKLSTDNPDVQVVMSSFRNDVKKKNKRFSETWVPPPLG